MSAEISKITEDNLDQLLSGFFKAALPTPFPPARCLVLRDEMPMPLSTITTPNRRALSRSRLSLAASVALLLGGCWYISNQIGTQVDRPTVGKGEGSAKVPKAILNAHDAAKKMTP